MNWDNLWNYIRGERTGKKANRMERDALSDPFLYEALEGLTEMEGDHASVVTELEYRLQKRVHPQGGKRIIYRSLVAASVLLMGGVAVFLLLRKNEPIEDELMMTEQMVVVNKDSLPVDSIIVEKGDGNVLVAKKETKVSVDKKEKVLNSPVMEGQGGADYEVDTIKADIKLKKMAFATPVKNRSLGNVRSIHMKEVTGRVVDQEGKPLPGTSVWWCDNSVNQGVVTDVDGYFKIKVSPQTKQLTASYIGMKAVVVSVADTGQLQIVMKENRIILSEAAVTGWQEKIVTKTLGAAQILSEKESQERQLIEAIKSFDQYVVDSVCYPTDALCKSLEGDVLLSFRLNKQKQPVRIKIVKSISASCDAEAVRLLEQYRGFSLVDVKKRIYVTVPFRLKK